MQGRPSYTLGPAVALEQVQFGGWGGEPPLLPGAVDLMMEVDPIYSDIGNDLGDGLGGR